MNTSPAELLSLLLIEWELGADLSADANADWPLFTANLPDDRDQAITVYDTAGVPDGRMMRTGEQIIHPGVQVRITALDPVAGWRKAKEVAIALDSLQEEWVAPESDTPYSIQNISRTGDILPMGMEKQGDRWRYNFTVNAVMTLRSESGYQPFAPSDHSLFLVENEP